MIKQFKLMRENEIIAEGVQFLSSGLVAINWIANIKSFITVNDSIECITEQFYDDYSILWVETKEGIKQDD